MLLDVIALSFLIAFIRGGRIRSIPKFDKLFLLAICVVLQLSTLFITNISGILISVSYVFLLLFLIFNRKHEDIRIFIVGWLLNAAVIWANGGKMPLDLEQAGKLPYSIEPVINGTDFKHSVLGPDTHLNFLADFIYMPYLIPRVISIGDLFIMLGAFLLIQRVMDKPVSLIHLREGKTYEVKQ